MGFCLVWIDKEGARVREISEDRMQRRDLAATPDWFERLAALLRDSRVAAVIGPDDQRDRFLAYLKETCPDLAPRIVACEAEPGSGSDAELAEAATRLLHATGSARA